MIPKPLDTVMRSSLKIFPDVVARRTVKVLCNLRMFFQTEDVLDCGVQERAANQKYLQLGSCGG